MDGDPVSVLEDTILVAFKNNIHRETTEKPANKQVIEGVLQEKLGKPYRLVTMMQKDWTDALEGAGPQQKEELKLEHEHEDKDPNAKPWIDEALQIFGEDLVIIKD
jgi:DNA polymerase-3 subunit gamma/tau